MTMGATGRHEERQSDVTPSSTGQGGGAARPLRIALVGTRGVPARYGGFETAAEEIGQRLAARGHQVRAYCRTGNSTEPMTSYLGMDLVTLPALRKRSLETLSHVGLSVAHLYAHRVDAVLMFNAANSPWLPFLRLARLPVAVNVDGLEWKRAKWSGAGRKYYRSAEARAVRWADAIVADAAGIAQYYQDEFGAPTTQIYYGAPILGQTDLGKLAELGLEPEKFHVAVARFEPENHVREIVEGYVRSQATLPLVVVGSAPYANEYTDQVHAAAQGDPRVRFLGGVWDQDQLNALYANALTYLHGQSVGGTNPSLLRAIGGGTAVLSYDVVFNREILRGDGQFFRTPAQLAALLEGAEADVEVTRAHGAALLKRAADYDWDDVAAKYEKLAQDLAARRTPGPQWRARRRPTEFWTGDMGGAPEATSEGAR